MMNEIRSKVYYDVFTGEVLAVTSEFQGDAEPTTMERDIDIYSQLKNKDIAYIELEYGSLSTIFNDAKSYSVDIDTKKLNLNYFTDDELQEKQRKYEGNITLNNRAVEISDYLLEQENEIITGIEDYIIQTEMNKIMEGMI